VQYLTVQDELSLVAYYLFQLTRLCKAFKFSTNVESTAMTYLKRFYLRNTCMDYHPKNVMCVYDLLLALHWRKRARWSDLLAVPCTLPF
jgi:cyclin H